MIRSIVYLLKKLMERDGFYLPTHEEVMDMYPSNNYVILTDERDIAEFNRRMDNGICQQKREELYSVNPDFDGVYTY